MQKCDILYVGPSLNNCPRLKLLAEAMQGIGLDVLVSGITKTSAKSYLPYNYIEYNYGSGSNIVKKIRIVICFARMLFDVILRKPRFVYCINPLAGAIGLISKTIWGTKIVYETQEMYCGVEYSGIGTHIKNILVCIDRTVASKSELFVTTDQFRERFLNRLYKLRSQPSVHIYNVSQTGMIVRDDMAQFMANLRPRFKKIALYAGGVSADRGVVELIKVARQFENDEYAFVIAGSNDGSVSLEDLEKFTDKNIFRISSPNHDDLKYLSAHADVAFALYRPASLNNRYASPNKIFDSIGDGVPIITTNSPLGRYIMQQTSLCFCVQWNCSDNIVKQITKILRENLFVKSSSIPENLKYEYQRRKLGFILRDAFEIEGLSQ